MPKVLLVSLRAGDISDQIAMAEHRDFLQATGLDPEDLPQIVIDSPDVSAGDLSGYDGILVGGSSLNITNEHWDEWQLHAHAEMQRIVDSGLPVFLVCYGASWLARTSGGEVSHSHPEQSGPTIVELTDAGRRDVLTAGFPDRFTSLTGHTENSESVGPAVTVLATGPTCPIQFVRTGEQVWATQFHSDMDAVAMRARMDYYYDYGYFSPDDYDAIVAELPNIDTTWSNRLLRNFVAYCAGDLS